MGLLDILGIFSLDAGFTKKSSILISLTRSIKCIKVVDPLSQIRRNIVSLTFTFSLLYLLFVALFIVIILFKVSFPSLMDLSH